MCILDDVYVCYMVIIMMFVFVKWCLLGVCDDDDVRQFLCFVRCDHNDDDVLDYYIWVQLANNNIYMC